MTRHRRPPSLYGLCHRWFAEHLCERVTAAEGHAGGRCNQILSDVRLRLRPFFVEHLPAVVRTSLLREASEMLLKKSLVSGVDCDYGR